MTSRKSIKVRLLSILAPSILLLVLFGTSLSQEVFHRLIMHEGQSFFWGYCHNDDRAITLWYQGDSSRGPNPHFLEDDTMYYNALQEAGFNEATAMVLRGTGEWNYVSADFYHGIKVWNYNGRRIDDYGHAQNAHLEVGPGDTCFFHTPYKSSFVATTDPIYEFGVFFCDSAETADTLICSTTGDRLDTRISARVYHIQLRLRVDDIDTTWEDPPVLWMKVGSGYSEEGPAHNGTDFYNAIPTAWQMYMDTTADTDTNPDTTFYRYISQMDTGRYDTIEFITTLTYKAPLHITIYWYGLMDLYLDWIRIHDQQYQTELAELRRNRGYESSCSFVQR